jgi:predicted nucleic acid-binding protein
MPFQPQTGDGEEALVDTSVWIDYFSAHIISPEKTYVRNMIADQRTIYICPVIYQEVLQGVREQGRFDKIKAKLQDVKMLTIDLMAATEYAIELYRTLRRQGATIRKPADCLIAAYAMLGDVHLLHKDRDFTEIARAYPLKVIKLWR